MTAGRVMFGRRQVEIGGRRLESDGEMGGRWLKFDGEIGGRRLEFDGEMGEQA